MAIDWTKIYEEYKGRWVALHEDEQTVISSGLTAKEAFEGALKHGCEKPVLAHMPEQLLTYIG